MDNKTLINKASELLKKQHDDVEVAYKLLYNFNPLIKNKLDFISCASLNTLNEEEYFAALNDYLVNQKPLAYIIHKTNFYGYEFIINDNVFSPRKETELLVENVINTIEDLPKKKILDLCSGSGVIGITIKKKVPTSEVTLTDIDLEAMQTSKENAIKLNAKVDIRHGDFIDTIIKKELKFDVIVCNPPYIDKAAKLPKSVYDYEPHAALFAPDHGLFFYEKLFSTYEQICNPKFMIALEIGFDQKAAIQKLIDKYIKKGHVRFIKDYDSNDRVCIIDNLL